MKSIVPLISLMLFSVLGTAQTNVPNKEYDKYLKQIEKYYKSKERYKLYKKTKKALNRFPNDPWFNYLYAYGLYYSKKHKKIKKRYSKTALLEEILAHLSKAKPLNRKTSRGFAKGVQRLVYNHIKKVWKKKDFEAGLPYATFLFEYFDNSTPLYQNNFSEQVQDELFAWGKSLYLEGKKAEAIPIFDWMHQTFSTSNFVSKYDGTQGYPNKDYIFEAYKNPLYCLANTASEEDHYTEIEKRIIYLHNLVRMNPPLFNKTFVATHYRLASLNNHSSYSRSLREDLANAKSCPILNPDINLFNAAKYHALDMGRTGGRGHDSSDGRSAGNRIRSFNVTGPIGENIALGRFEPLEILMALLIDYQVPSLGHRKNILNSDFDKIGLSMQKHLPYRSCVVIDYGG